MPFQVSWLVEKQVILATASGECTMTEVAELDLQITEFLRLSRQNNLTHLILYLWDVTKFPTNIGEINQHSDSRREPNFGWVIVVNDNRLIRFVANVITQLTRMRFRNFETLKEATDFLKSQDTTIDWSLVTIDQED